MYLKVVSGCDVTTILSSTMRVSLEQQESVTEEQLVQCNAYCYNNYYSDVSTCFFLVSYMNEIIYNELLVPSISSYNSKL